MEPKENGINIGISVGASENQKQKTSISLTKAAKQLIPAASVFTRSKSAVKSQQSGFSDKQNLYEIFDLDSDASREESTF